MGHEHFSQPRRSHQHYFRGAAHFDLTRISAISAIPSKVVTKAVLQYRLRASAVRDGAGAPEPFPLLTSCATELLSADTDWRVGAAAADGVIINDKAAFPGEPVRSLSTAPGAGGGTLFNVDVTELAQRWWRAPNKFRRAVARRC